VNVEGKVAIVTGASSGIGLAASKMLSKRAVKVALVARSKQTLEKLSAEIPNSFPVPADMSRAFEVKRMIKAVQAKFGRIDILVNNAGKGYDAQIETMDFDTFHYIFDLNLVGQVVAMQQVIPIMRKLGGGTIVNVSSAVAFMHLPNNGPYASLKLALSQISLTAREELKNDKISVGVVYPYITLTNFEKNTIRETLVPEDEQEPRGPFPPDSAEYAAEKILECIVKEEPEVFARDWIRQRAHEV
jgi:short-subunit dehydrogenase